MRIFAFLVVVLLLVFGLTFGYLRITQASSATETVTYVVEKGDTLWDIALKFAPVSMDIRDYVYRLRQTNGLRSSATIYPGQELKLPTR